MLSQILLLTGLAAITIAAPTEFTPQASFSIGDACLEQISACGTPGYAAFASQGTNTGCDSCWKLQATTDTDGEGRYFGGPAIVSTYFMSPKTTCSQSPH